MNRVTLKDIAQKAGVSVSAVSLALSGKGNISKQQQDRIRKIADELGYVPNPILASLASKRFRSGDHSEGTLIAVLEFPTIEGWASGGQYRDELIKTSKELGYQARLMNLKEIRSYSDVAQTLYRCGMQGVIVTGQPPTDLFEEIEKWKHFALVQCGRFRQSLPIHTVRTDVFRSIKLIYNSLSERGYKRIGFALGCHPEVLEDDEARLGSALAMLNFHVAPEQRVTPFTGEFDDSEGLTDWVSNESPDAVVAFTIGQYYNLKDAGWKMPEELGFATLHLPLTRQNRGDNEPQFSGLVQHTDVIAQQSVMLLDQLIRYNTRGFPEQPRHTLIPPNWVEGETVRGIGEH